MNNLDIATGKLSTIQSGPDVYTSQGKADTFDIKQVAPPEPQPTCYILSLSSTCTNEQRAAVLNGTAIVKDYVVVDMKGKASGKPGAPSKTQSGAASTRNGSVSRWAVLSFAIWAMGLALVG